MNYRSRTGAIATVPVLFIAAAMTASFGGCGDDTTGFQPDGAADDASTEDAPAEASGDDAMTTPVKDASPSSDAGPDSATPPADAGPDVTPVPEASADAAPDAPATEDAAVDAPDDSPADASGDGPTCDLGAAGSYATQQDLTLFGAITYFDNGAVLPAGHYRVQNLGGCMKYSNSGQDWTVHAYADGSDAFWIGTVSGDKLFMPPGTVGYSATLGGGGAYVDFDDCVAANLALAPAEFDFVGGQLGVWLADDNPGDNVAGVSDDGGIDNPKWSLTLLSGSCTNIE
jgi:hypothetical protein